MAVNLNSGHSNLITAVKAKVLYKDIHPQVFWQMTVTCSAKKQTHLRMSFVEFGFLKRCSFKNFSPVIISTIYYLPLHLVASSLICAWITTPKKDGTKKIVSCLELDKILSKRTFGMYFVCTRNSLYIHPPQVFWQVTVTCSAQKKIHLRMSVVEFGFLKRFKL